VLIAAVVAAVASAIVYRKLPSVRPAAHRAPAPSATPEPANVD
jgi:hypothetical protein